jgi:hypothetical protein
MLVRTLSPAIEPIPLNERILAVLWERELAQPPGFRLAVRTRSLALALWEPTPRVAVELVAMERAGVIERMPGAYDGRAVFWSLLRDADPPRVELGPMLWSGLSSATVAAMLPPAPPRV